VITVFFFRLMVDGRKLRSRLRLAEAPQSEPRLISADYPAWMSQPVAVSSDETGPADVPFRRGDIGFPGSDGLAS
jgi:hypothetical protein